MKSLYKYLILLGAFESAFIGLMLFIGPDIGIDLVLSAHSRHILVGRSSWPWASLRLPCSPRLLPAQVKTLSNAPTDTQRVQSRFALQLILELAVSNLPPFVSSCRADITCCYAVCRVGCCCFTGSSCSRWLKALQPCRCGWWDWASWCRAASLPIWPGYVFAPPSHLAERMRSFVFGVDCMW
jgi:hypothetical protein